MCSLWWPFPLKVLPQSANAGVFLFGSGLPKPQSTQVPGPLAKEVGAGLCFPAYLGCPGPGEVERGPLGAQRSRSKKLSLFWSLIPVQQLTPGQIAMKQSPCSRPPAACLSAPAPEDFSSSRVKKKKKTGRTGSLVQLPGLEPPAFIFFLSASNEVSLKLHKKAQRMEGARGPDMPQPLWTALSRVQSWVNGKKRRGGKGCPREELAALDCCSTFKPKGVPKNV